MPAHCRSGECGWCYSKLVGNQVYIPKRVDGRREADFIYGYIHSCCAFPLSDLTIEVAPVAKLKLIKKADVQHRTSAY